MSTANYYIVEKPLQFHEGIIEQSRLELARPKVETKPEERLWKIAAASPRTDRIDLIALLFFCVQAIAALACCFSVLFPLINTGALDETIRAFLTK